jgi:hypothetical protein
MSDVERFGKLRDHLVSTRRQEVAKVLGSIACHHPETESVIQSEEDHADPPSTVVLRASKRASQEANLFLQQRKRASTGKVVALRS